MSQGLEAIFGKEDWFAAVNDQSYERDHERIILEDDLA